MIKAEVPHHNRLARESSPYLLQHAENPVDWYPWGDEAITKAKKEDKPIFLSIGYSACHWCHVMERESFENQQTADVLNQYFISIKVDREERPDIDAIYMRAVQMMTGSGGWPLSVFLTPDLKPFFGGTYFPPEAKHGQPGFKDLLLHIKETYRTRKSDIKKDANAVTEQINGLSMIPKPEGILHGQILIDAAGALLKNMDPKWGGFAGTQKFPSPPSLEYLLRYSMSGRPVAPVAFQALEGTLLNMAAGGIYDQVGGGFHRYSTDEHWRVPHFEKMLYDNAQLAKLYTEAWQLTHREVYRQIAQETCDYLTREMKSPHGGFYASQDADSDGTEGKFYTWPWHEIEIALQEKEKDINLIQDLWNITKPGNFEEGRNILFLNVPDLDRLGELAAIKKTMVEWRKDHKTAPARDEKILTDWNALTIGALAYAGRAFDRKDYISAAQAAADYILKKHVSPDGYLVHSLGKDKFVAGLLEDYAYMIVALTELYEATLDKSYLKQAERLSNQAMDLFYDPQRADFYSFPRKGADVHLVANIKEIYDGVTPSGTAVMARALVRISRYFGNEPLKAIAENILRHHVQEMQTHPAAVTYMLAAFLENFEEPWQVEISGDPKSRHWVELWKVLNAAWWPSRMTAALRPEENSKDFPWVAQLSQDKKKEVKVYLCRGKNCLLPTADAQELESFLKQNLAHVYANNSR